MSLSTILSVLIAANALADVPAASPSDDAQDVVLLAADQPVFVRLHLQVEGKGFRTLQPELIGRLFETFDADHDQVWSAGELETAQKSGRLSILGNDATFDPKALDKNRNDKLDRDEFVAHALPALGAPFLVRADPQSPARSLNLFERVDDDENGKLSSGELQSAWRLLRKQDLDDDELLSLTELLPPELTTAQPVAPMPAARVDLPIVAVTADAIPTLVRTLLRRYAPSGKLKLPVKSLQLADKLVKPFDKDGDGQLSRTELAELLRQPPPHREVLVKLPRGKGGRISLQLLAGSGAGARGTTSVTINQGGFVAEIRGASTAAAVKDNRAFYKVQFLRADGDKNGYLDETEFGNGLGLEVSFAQVDRDGNKMVTDKEVLEHLSLDDQLNESRIELLVTNDGRSLFEILDANFDQRISPREFSETGNRISSRDANKDGLLDAGELGSRYRMSLSLDRPKLFQSTGTMMVRNPTGGRPARPKIDAPDWFLKMDRNRDGDVSAREFLGPSETFAKLDADRNGVLDPAEAAAAK